MVRPGTRPFFTVAEASRIAGVDERTLSRYGERGLIEIRQRGRRRVVDRHELARFLRESGYEESLWRPAFQPSAGQLLVVRPAIDIPVWGLCGTAPTICRSLLDLGQRLRVPTWAVVLDFIGLGRSVAVEAAAELRGGDAPLLVAVTADDDSGSGLGDFDLLIARPVVVGGFVAGLNNLRRSVERLSTGQPTAGRRSRRRHKGSLCPTK